MQTEDTFIEISKELDRAEITKGVGEMFIVCGLREAEMEQILVDIRVNLVSLVSKANDLCDSLKVSSILPPAKPNERINLLNDLIWDVCGQFGATFVDNDNNFFFRQNTRDRTALRGNMSILCSYHI